MPLSLVASSPRRSDDVFKKDDRRTDVSDVGASFHIGANLNLLALLQLELVSRIIGVRLV
jgi:hypothetical protein